MVAHRLVEAGDLLLGESEAEPEGRHPRGVQDLVGVGVADPGDDALVAEHPLDAVAYAAQQPGERLPGEGVVERVGAEAGDARHLAGVAHAVHGEPLAGARLGEVEAGALRSGEQQPQRQRAPAGARRGLGQSVLPAQPARPGEVDDQVGAVGGQVEELAVAAAAVTVRPSRAVSGGSYVFSTLTATGRTRAISRPTARSARIPARASTSGSSGMPPVCRSTGRCAPGRPRPTPVPLRAAGGGPLPYCRSCPSASLCALVRRLPMPDTGQRERSAPQYDPYEAHEAYEGGSPEAERLLFEKLARELMGVQRAQQQASGAAQLLRTFHAKAALGVDNARLRFYDRLPPELCVGYARPGAAYPAVVRLSNESGTARHDATPDLRGMAVRVQVAPGESHDLLATSFPVSHAADAREFVAFAKATAGADTTVERAFGLFVRLPLAVGWGAADRMRRNVHTATRYAVGSLARETFWSRGAILWGAAGPVRYQLRPAPGGTPAPLPDSSDPDYLRHELTMRLATGDVCFELCVQRYADERRTPVEDGSVEWRESDAPGRPGGAADRTPPGSRHRRGAVGGPPGRAARVQPVAHHGGVPAAGQPQPGPQGGVRGGRRAPSRAVLQHRAAARHGPRGAGAGRGPAGVRPGRPLCAVAPAAGATGAARPGRAAPDAPAAPSRGCRRR